MLSILPSTIQDIEVDDFIFNDEDIHITREDPEVSFDKESNMDDGENDVLGNTDSTQDAFIFCLNM